MNENGDDDKEFLRLSIFVHSYCLLTCEWLSTFFFLLEPCTYSYNCDFIDVTDIEVFFIELPEPHKYLSIIIVIIYKNVQDLA